MQPDLTKPDTIRRSSTTYTINHTAIPALLTTETPTAAAYKVGYGADGMLRALGGLVNNANKCG